MSGALIATLTGCAAPRGAPHRTATAVATAVATASAPTDTAPAAVAPTAVAPTAVAPTDRAFAALQARGADPRAMGVDQYTSVHRFDALPDGGRIALQRGVDDSAGVAQIRQHLREIAGAFAAGDFRTPAFVHLREGAAPPVPGTVEMAARRAAIRYTVSDLPRGGAVRITTGDPEALRAVHAFLAFQRADHRAGGVADPHAGHAGHAGHSGPAHP